MKKRKSVQYEQDPLIKNQIIKNKRLLISNQTKEEFKNIIDNLKKEMENEEYDEEKIEKIIIDTIYKGEGE